jgi:hypothetical protein
MSWVSFTITRANPCAKRKKQSNPHITRIDQINAKTGKQTLDRPHIYIYTSAYTYIHVHGLHLELVGVERRADDPSLVCPCLAVGEDEADAGEGLQEALQKRGLPQRQAVLGGEDFLEDLHVGRHDESIGAPPNHMPFALSRRKPQEIKGESAPQRSEDACL